MSTRYIRFIDRMFERIECLPELTVIKLVYFGHVLLGVPMLLFMHQWILLSPTSSYLFIEIFLFIIRYSGN